MVPRTEGRTRNRYGDWVARAERDLERARIDVDTGTFEWACFTLEQAAEKAVTALHLSLGRDGWGHSVTQLLRALPVQASAPEALVRGAQTLDAYDIAGRYPNGFPAGKPADYFNETKAQEAVDAAAAIVRFCHDNLPV